MAEISDEQVERPITSLPRDTGEPAWMQINDLLMRHGITCPVRLRDELVSLWSWARYAEAALLPRPVEAGVPKGFKLVPEEPTEMMIDAAEEDMLTRSQHGMRIYASDVWDIMVAASPTSPATGDEG